MNEMFPCPCCGYLTVTELECYEICPVCNWEDDPYQSKNPDYAGGANQMSLNQAKANFSKFGASSERFLKEVRPPLPDEIPEIKTK